MDLGFIDTDAVTRVAVALRRLIFSILVSVIHILGPRPSVTARAHTGQRSKRQAASQNIHS